MNALRWGAVVGWASVMAVFNLAGARWVAEKLRLPLRLGSEGGLPLDGLFTAFHLLGSALLGLLVVNAQTAGFDRSVPRRTLGITLGVLVFFALTLEGLQQFVPSRDASVQDALANLLGVSAGYGVGLLARRRRAARKKG